jgi:hypothetical protein
MFLPVQVVHFHSEVNKTAFNNSVTKMRKENKELLILGHLKTSIMLWGKVQGTMPRTELLQ